MPFDPAYFEMEEPQAREAYEMEKLKRENNEACRGRQTVCERGDECCGGGKRCCSSGGTTGCRCHAKDDGGTGRQERDDAGRGATSTGDSPANQPTTNRGIYNGDWLVSGSDSPTEGSKP